MKTILCAVAALVMSSTGDAATINVPGDFATIQEAVNTASNGDTILVAPGVHFGFLEEGVVDMLGKEISLLSTDGPLRTFIDGEFTRRGITCASGETPNTIIDGFTIVGGSAFEGGGILCSGSSPTIRNCIVDGNSASFGGGVRCTTSSGPLFEDCQFAGNFSDFCGGAIACAFDSEITLARCEIIENFAVSFGGGLFMELGCNAIVSDSVISGNSTEFDGGGIWSSGSSGTFSNTEITDNFALNSAGGIYSESSSLALEGVLLSGNLAESEGGALVAIQSDVDLLNSVLAQNGSFGKTQSSIVVDSESVVFAQETSFFGEEVDGTIAFGLCNEFFLDSKEILVVSQLRPTATFQSIQPAVNAASDGTLIVVMKGVYTDTGQEVVDMLGKQIVLNSTGNVDDVVIDGEDQRRGIVCTNGETNATIIKGFTIRNCRAVKGAGINCEDSSPTITCCHIVENTIDINASTGPIFGNGGGISCDGGSPRIIDCLIANNTATENGGGISCSESSPNIERCTIEENRAFKGGGIHCSGGEPVVDDCLIQKNNKDVESFRGGGMNLEGSNFTVKSCRILDNEAGNHGGGIDCFLLADTAPTITDCLIEDNQADGGGGVHCESFQFFDSADPLGRDALQIIGCTIRSNKAVDGKGGGLQCVHSNVVISGGRISNNLTTATNSSANGGGIACIAESGLSLLGGLVVSQNIAEGNGGGISCVENASLEISNIEISANESFENGGGLHCVENSAPARISDCQILSNKADDDGGGIYIESDGITQVELEIEGGLIFNNDACGNVNNIGDGSAGGGIFVEGTKLKIRSCEINSNRAGVSHDGAHCDEGFNAGVFRDGGGLMAVDSDVEIHGGSFSGNKADDRGGAISCQTILSPAPTVVIDEQCVITNNQANFGGGIHSAGSPLKVTGCSVSSNRALDEAGGGILVSSGIFGVPTDAEFREVSILSNNANGDGGGLFFDAANRGAIVLIVDCSIKGNFAVPEDRENEGRGGGVHFRNQGGPVDILGGEIEGNTALTDGGGVYTEGSAPLSNPRFNGTRIVDNHAGDGGGIFSKALDDIPELTFATVCENDPNQIQGSFIDGGGNVISEECPPECPGDIDGGDDFGEDGGQVDGADLGLLLAAWGPCDQCLADLNSDGLVDGADLGLMLAAWGPCP